MKRENTLYYHTDHLGSSGYVTDKKGEFYEHTEYTSSSGESWVNEKVTGNADLPYKYTGHRFDSETNLYYCGARYYDAKTSRFISADDRIDGLFSTQGQSMYSYVHNNPINFIDPDGHELKTFGFFRKKDADTQRSRQKIIAEQRRQQKIQESNARTSSKSKTEIFRAAAGVAFATDVMTPEPTDVAPQKWIGWGVVGIAVLSTYAYDAISSDDVKVDTLTERDRQKKKEIITVFHGSYNNYDNILEHGLNSSRIPAYAATERAFAVDAIVNRYEYQFSKGNSGIIGSAIPKDVWDKLIINGDVRERTYNGWNSRMPMGKEYQFLTPKAVEVFNAGRFPDAYLGD